LSNQDDFIDFDLDINGVICTVLQAEPGHGRFVRYQGGIGRYGEVKVVVAPHPGIHCYRFVWAVADDALPLSFMRGACLEGVKDALARPLTDGRQIAFVQVTVVDGSYHDQDTDAHAVMSAASMAVQNALGRATLVDI
jgi:elongation factor G